ncbi:hypothetical protein EC960109_4326A, partial [Escherichia coli 96.0109]
MLACSPHPNP